MLLQPGANVLAALLGRGRFAAPRPDARTFGTPRLRLQLTLDYADGTHGMIVSDAGWFVTTEGPLRANNEYDGETYDTRRELAGWAQPGFDARDWQPAQVFDSLGGQMVGTVSPPSRMRSTRRPRHRMVAGAGSLILAKTTLGFAAYACRPCLRAARSRSAMPSGCARIAAWTSPTCAARLRPTASSVAALPSMSSRASPPTASAMPKSPDCPKRRSTARCKVPSSAMICGRSGTSVARTRC
jgi:hypothetical protein